MILKKSGFIFTFLLMLSSCTYNPLDVDADDVKVEVKYINMDSLFRETNTEKLLVYHHDFQRDLKEVYEYHLGYCLRIGTVTDSIFLDSYSSFQSDKYVKRLEKRISEKFKDLSPYQKEITDGFKHLKYHFPDGKTPEYIVFMNSFFAANAFTTQTEVAVGLERYLSKETDVISEIPADQLYEWMKEGFDDEFLTRDVLCSWIMTHYVEEVDGNLAEHMIRWGKIIYLTQAAFPDKSPADIMRYSEEDFKWAEENEYSLWKYLVDEKLLFSKDEQIRANMLNEGPFTIGLPEKGPDRLGQFLGYRMVKKYIEIEKPEVKDLLKTSYTAILAEYEID
jgi:hypothetical protein